MERGPGLAFKSSAAIGGCAAGLLMVLMAGCAAGKTNEGSGGGPSTDSGTGASTTQSTAGSTSSAGGTGATGGQTTSMGGTAGTTTTGGNGGTTESGGTGGSGGTTTSGSGGSGTGTVVLLAGGPSEILEATFDEGNGWSSATIPSGLGSAPAVAMESATMGVGVFRANAASGLLFIKWDGAGFSAPLSIGMQPSAQGSPSMVYGPDAYSVGYWGTDNGHYLVRYTGVAGGWSSPEPVKPPGGFQSIGNSAPSVASAGSDLILAHTGTDAKVYEQLRTGGNWQAATPHDVGGAQTSVSSTVIALSGGTEDLLIVYVIASNSQIGWITRTPGAPPTWSSAAVIANALTMDPIALAPLPNGGAIMAFRGLNTNIYTSMYQPGMNPAWSAPDPLANPNYSTPSSPALAPGVGLAAAELAFVDEATGTVLHSRLVSGSWQAPIPVGGNVQVVGLASAP